MRRCPHCGQAWDVPTSEELRSIRKLAGRTLREMADRSEYSATYFCKVEKGRMPVTRGVLQVYYNITRRVR